MRKEIRDKIDKVYEDFKTINLEEVTVGDKYIDVKTFKVTTKDGKEFYRDKVIKNNDCGSSVSVLPVLENGNVLLLIEPRVFTKRTVEINVPGGYINKGESTLEAAKRELEEETALKSDNIIKVADYYTDLGNSDYISSTYIALDAKRTGETHFDSDEFVEEIEVTIDELNELIESGEIMDTPLIVASVKLNEMLKK